MISDRPDTTAHRPAHRIRLGLAAAVLAAAALVVSGCSAPPPTPVPTTAPTNGAQADAIAAAVQQQIDAMSLGAVLVKVQIGDDVVIDRAWGDSMTGVPATTDMRFRNGAVAFAYIGNLLLQDVDAGLVSLDDPIDRWMPDLPEAHQVTLKMLANQTSGYPDYEVDAAWTAAYNADPFHEFTYDERIAYAFSKPPQFAPGTNWSYSHTNFMILGQILAKIGGAPLDQLLETKVLRPLGLDDTVASDTATIPEPALHAFSSERRVALGIPSGTAFSEEATYWNPAWGTPPGGAETTTVHDLVTTAIAIGTGALLTDASFHAMTDPNLLGFGSKQANCIPSCFTQIPAYNYGLGIVRSGDWILQNPQLSGYSAVMAYLPAEKIAIGVATTYAPGAFNSDGTYPNAADRVFRAIGAVVAKDAPPAAPPLPPRY
ncbi:serine hydrolase domain-containing protein [Microbacterium sp. X-17]|uniref:serine hydrolase domain-containing protein n=1 Tax=Microbacterium sp. X-17 TaxID=3144404 RepID=UPI0031F5C3D4